MFFQRAKCKLLILVIMGVGSILFRTGSWVSVTGLTAQALPGRLGFPLRKTGRKEGVPLLEFQIITAH